jgi:hypothetical protein
MALGALFLACKVEECPRKARDVLNCFCHLCDKRAGKTPAPVDMYSNAFVNLKDKLIRAERELLKELGFILYSEHPHKFILNYVKLLSPSKDKEPVLAQAAWNFINDSQRTNVCMKYAPEVICCAAIWFAARSLGIKLPSHTTPPWWELFDAKKEDMDAVCATVTDLYSRPRAHYVKLDPPPEAPKPAPPPAPFMAEGPPEDDAPLPEVAQPAQLLASARSAAAAVLARAATATPAAREPAAIGSSNGVANGGASNGAHEGGVANAAPASSDSPLERAEAEPVERAAASAGGAGDAAPATARSGDTASEDGERRDGELREANSGGSEHGDRGRDDDGRRRRRDGDEERDRDKRRRREEFDRRDDRKEERGGFHDRRDRRDFDRRDRRDDRRRDYHRR